MFADSQIKPDSYCIKFHPTKPGWYSVSVKDGTKMVAAALPEYGGNITGLYPVEGPFENVKEITSPSLTSITSLKPT